MFFFHLLKISKNIFFCEQKVDKESSMKFLASILSECANLNDQSFLVPIPNLGVFGCWYASEEEAEKDRRTESEGSFEEQEEEDGGDCEKEGDRRVDFDNDRF